MADATVRAFVAIQLSSELQEEIDKLTDPLQSRFPHFRFVEPKNRHLTLQFLGDTELRKIDQIRKAFPEALKGILPFEISLQTVGVFSSSSHARVLWIGIGGDLDSLGILKQRLDSILESLNLKVEKQSYHPHITIARIKSAPQKIELKELADFKGKVKTRVEGVTLFESKSMPQGAVHTPLEKFQFPTS